MNTAQIIKNMLKEKGIKQKEFLSNFNLTRNQLDIWKKRNTIPPVLLLYDIAKYLNCRIEDLIGKDYLE